MSSDLYRAPADSYINALLVLSNGAVYTGRGAKAQAVFTAPDGGETIAELLCRIDTPDELAYFANGGILHKALRELAA